MPQPRITAQDEGELLDLGGLQARILEDGTGTDHRLAIAELIVPPHMDGPPQHWHGSHDETFFVLTGTARFTVGDRSYDEPPGTLVTVPIRTPHTFANAGDVECRMLNTFTPHFYVEYLRDLARAATPGEPMDHRAILAIMARYDTYPADTSRVS